MRGSRTTIVIVLLLAVGAATPARANRNCPSGTYGRGTEQIYCCADNSKMRVICISQCCAADHMASAGCDKRGGVGNPSNCQSGERVTSVQFSDPTFSVGGNPNGSVR